MRLNFSLLTLLSENNSCHKLIQFLFDFFHSWFLVIFSDFVFFLVMKYSFHHSYVLIFNVTHKDIQIKYIDGPESMYIFHLMWREMITRKSLWVSSLFSSCLFWMNISEGELFGKFLSFSSSILNITSAELKIFLESS